MARQCVIIGRTCPPIGCSPRSIRSSSSLETACCLAHRKLLRWWVLWSLHLLKRERQLIAQMESGLRSLSPSSPLCSSWYLTNGTNKQTCWHAHWIRTFKPALASIGPWGSGKWGCLKRQCKSWRKSLSSARRWRSRHLAWGMMASIPPQTTSTLIKIVG